MEKKLLREILTDRARALPAGTRRAQSGAIARKVLESDVWQRAGSVFIYVSTPLEPDTRPLFEAAFAAGKRVYAPKCVGTEMFAVRITSLSDLVPGRWGIPEPRETGDGSVSHAAYAKTAEEKPVETQNRPLSQIDLTVTPCVGASANGARLGRGAGFYDRYFEAHPTYKLCLCFPSLLTDGIPMGERDAWMDEVVFDKEE